MTRPAPDRTGGRARTSSSIFDMKKRMYGEMSVDTVFHSTRIDCQIPVANFEPFLLSGTWVDCLLLVFRVVSQAETTDF